MSYDLLDGTSSSFELLEQLLVDSNSKVVRVTTVMVLGKLAEMIKEDEEKNVEAFQRIIPAMANVLEQCIQENDEENTSHVFQVFDTLLILDVPLLSNSLPHLIQYFLHIAINQEVDTSIRVMDLNTLASTVIYKRREVKRLKIVPLVVENLIPMAAQEQWDDFDTDDDSPAQSAYRVLNGLSTDISPQQVFTAVMPFVGSYMRNPDPYQRKCAMMTLSVIMEGCVDYMRPNLDEILTVICHGLQDSEIAVSRAACIALSVLTENFPRNVTNHHRILFPPVLNLMKDTDSNVAKSACLTIDNMLDELGETVAEYLPILMERLVTLLDHAPQRIVDIVLTTLGKTVQAAGKSFQRYFDPIWPRLRHFLTLKDDTGFMRFYCSAADTLRSVIGAIGLDMFRPYSEDLLHLTLEQAHSQCSSIRESSYLLLGVAARVLGEEFTPYLPTAVTALLACCRLEEGESYQVSEDAMKFSSNYDTESEEPTALNFNFILAIEKQLAVETLGKLFKYLPSQFMPYLEESVNDLRRLSRHVIDDVRKAAVTVLFLFIQSCNAMSNTKPWEPGSRTHQLHANVELQRLIMITMPDILSCWKYEDNKTIVIQICRELSDTLDQTGPCVVVNDLEEITRLLADVFEKKSACMDAYDDDEDEDDDEYTDGSNEDEFESLLIGTAAHLVSRLARSIGSDFFHYFDRFLPLISEYCEVESTRFERSKAIRCLGECIVGTGSVSTTHTEGLLSLFLHACGDESPSIRGDGAYGLGVLATYVQVDISQQASGSHAEADWALGAVARLILAHPRSVPLDSVLPAFIHALPIKMKYTENEVVFDCIIKLIHSNHPVIFTQLPQLVHIFSKVLLDEQQLSPTIRAQLLELIRALNAQVPELHLTSSELAPFVH
ncbi:hypothetical protein DFQ28_011649 [Apophysomyces sp. BC1034]|nr:hypothetical protein DFQ28_011649 [Apophysomyces sp. BC1034]